MKRLLFLVPCGLALCALNATAVCAQELPSLPQPIEETVVAQPALLDQLRAGTVSGTMTAEAAWEKKLLDEKSALTLLEGSLGSTEGDDEDQRLRAQLAGALVNHAPQSLQPLDKKSLRLKRAVADYYASIKDERAIAIYQALAVRPELPPVVQATTFRTLGNYQRRLGKTEAAVASFLQAEARFEKLGIRHAAGEMLILAARTYRDVGQDKKAEALYAQVARVGDGWMTGLALYDQATALTRGSNIDLSKHKEARRLLSQPIEGSNPEPMRVLMLALLGNSYFRTEEFPAARKYCEQALARYDLLSPPPSDVGLIQQVQESRDVLRSIDLWTKEPILCEPRELHLFINRNKEGKPVAARFNLRTFGDTPLTVTSEDARVKTWVSSELKSGNTESYHFRGRDAYAWIPSSGLDKSFDTVLVISSTKFPDFKARVLLHVEVVDAPAK